MIKEHGKEVTSPCNNKIVGDITLANSNIIFGGKGNILFSDGSVTLKNSTINFYGDDAVVFLTGSKIAYILNLAMWRETAAYLGGDLYFNGVFNAIISERQNLIVGSDCIFSFGIWLRTADPHLVYSIETHKRINPSRSIMIGDHVWLGQNAMILKGSRIGSGSIVSANCVIAGKKVGSNTIYAGNPGRMVKEGIFFLKDSVHNYTKKKTKNSQRYQGEEYIYVNDGQIDFTSVNKALTDAKDGDSKLDIIRKELAGNTNKNRFYVEKEQKEKASLLKRLWG